MPLKDLNSNRPEIWADGRQSPPFDLRAFARASFLLGREGMAGLLGRCSASAATTAALVASGRWRVPEARLGRTGRYLPSYQTVGTSVACASDLLSRAANTLDPRQSSIIEPSIFAVAATAVQTPPPPRPEPKVHAQPISAVTPSTEASDPDLAAIRALIDETPSVLVAPLHAATAREQAFTLPPQAASTARARSKTVIWLSERLASATGALLGYGLLVVSLPYGAVKAGLAHLNGEDLRRLEV